MHTLDKDFKNIFCKEKDSKVVRRMLAVYTGYWEKG